MVKIKRLKTADCVVGGFRALDAPLSKTKARRSMRRGWTDGPMT